MFTGIIEERGEITAIERTADAARFTVRGPLAVSDAGHGDSIAVSGVCLTVVDRVDAPEPGAVFEVMARTLELTSLGSRVPGDRINLERALRADGRLDGHLVQGHVDGTGTLLRATARPGDTVLRLGVPDELAALVARRGSLAVDGVSLTVSDVSEPGAQRAWAEVSLIPETLRRTTLGERVPGDRVNLEIDVLARYAERREAVQAARA